jgi:hypothetical protein
LAACRLTASLHGRTRQGGEKLVELDEILHTLDEHGRLPAAAVASMLDLRRFDARLALFGAATWGLVRRDGRGAWLLTERGRAAVRSDALPVPRRTPLRRALRAPVLAAWVVAAVAAVGVLAAGWASRTAGPSAGSELRAASGTRSPAFVGISRSHGRHSHRAPSARSSAGGARGYQTVTSVVVPAARTRLGPRTATILPRVTPRARAGAIVLARVADGHRLTPIRPVPVVVRALRTSGHRLVSAPQRTSPKRKPKHRVAVRRH